MILVFPPKISATHQEDHLTKPAQVMLTFSVFATTCLCWDMALTSVSVFISKCCIRMSGMFENVHVTNKTERDIQLFELAGSDNDSGMTCGCRLLNYGTKPTETLSLSVRVLTVTQFVTQVFLFVTPNLSLDAFVPVVHSSESMVGH